MNLNYLMHHCRKNKIIIVFLSMILCAGISINTVHAATMSISPSSSNLIVGPGCQDTVDVIIDATGESSNASDLAINFNPNEISVASPVRTGDAYETYVYNKVDSVAGIIKLAGASFVNNLNSKKTFATLQITPKPGITSTTIKIKYNQGLGSSDIADSNTSLDLLKGVTDGVINFSSGICTRDTQSPQVKFISPYQYQQNFPSNDQLKFEITDNMSGVNLNSLVFDISGDKYKIGDPGVTYTGTSLDYNFIINLRKPLPNSQLTIFTVSGADNAGNQGQQQIVFNIPPSILSFPVCVPGGTTSTTNPIINSTNILNNIPKSISNLLTGNNNINVFDNTPLKNTIIDNVANSIGANGLLATLLLLLNLLPFITLLNAPGLLLNLLGVYFGKKIKKSWGIIIDASTKKPVPFATCRLYQSGTSFLTIQLVSDLDGRYGFSVGLGAYRLEIIKEGYQTYKKEIKVTANEDDYITDIFLKPLTMVSTYRENMFQKFFKFIGKRYSKIKLPLFIFGFLLSIFSVIVSPILFNFIILSLYILILILSALTLASKKPRFASIVDSQTNLRIPFAIIKFYEVNSGKLIDTQVTNSDGRFDFYGLPGDYAIFVAARGYKFPSMSMNNYPMVANKFESMIKVYLTNGGNKIILYADPLDNKLSSIQNGLGLNSVSNLQTPFG